MLLRAARCPCHDPCVPETHGKKQQQQQRARKEGEKNVVCRGREGNTKGEREAQRSLHERMKEMECFETEGEGWEGGGKEGAGDTGSG